MVYLYNLGFLLLETSQILLGLEAPFGPFDSFKQNRQPVFEF